MIIQQVVSECFSGDSGIGGGYSSVAGKLLFFIGLVSPLMGVLPKNV
jgi:hypothetical protein